MTIDTACSGSLVGLDVACRYLQTREINAAIIATSNLYLNPEHVSKSAISTFVSVFPFCPFYFPFWFPTGFAQSGCVLRFHLCYIGQDSIHPLLF